MAGNARSPKAHALGSALKTARESRKIVQRKLAEKIGRDPGLVSRWESGERTPKQADVSQILTALEVTGQEAADIIDLATGTDDPIWLAVTLAEQRQQLNALVDFESSATTIIQVAPLLIPGLLQSNDYILAIMNGGGVPPGEVHSRVALRVGRRQAITRRNPANLLVLLGEAALRNEVGGREVMVDQLRYLLEMTEFSNIELRVVPFTAGWSPLTEGSFMLIETSEQADIVSLENRRSALFLHDKDDVRIYRQAIEMIDDKAMDKSASVEFVAKVFAEFGGSR